MLCGDVAAYLGMVCVLCAVLSVTERTAHTPYLDMLPHHRITYNDVIFTEY